MNFINVYDSWLVSCRISFEIIKIIVHHLHNYKYFSDKIYVLYFEHVFTSKSSCIWISDIWDSTSFRHLEILCIYRNQRESRLISRFSSYVCVNHGKIIIVLVHHIWISTVSFHTIRPHVCQLVRRLETSFRVRIRYSTIPFRSEKYESIPTYCLLGAPSTRRVLELNLICEDIPDCSMPSLQTTSEIFFYTSVMIFFWHLTESI